MAITGLGSIIIFLEKRLLKQKPTPDGENQPSSQESTQEEGWYILTCETLSGQLREKEQRDEVAEPRAAGEVLHPLSAGETQGRRQTQGWPRAQGPRWGGGLRARNSPAAAEPPLDSWADEVLGSPQL